MTDHMTEMLCSDCEALVLFEAPEGGDDGDLMCVLCGAAVTIGGLLVVEALRAA